jgi:hypothetical protein
MGKKTVWVICIINVLASVFAIGWVTKPYWSKPAPSAPWAQPSSDPAPITPPSTNELWRMFEAARTSDQALAALAALPDDETAAPRLTEYRTLLQNTDSDSLGMEHITKRSAFLLFRGQRTVPGTPEHDWLLGYTLAKHRPVPEREAALRGAVLSALKEHKQKQAPADAEWRARLVNHLLENDFGRGTSVEALAVQALAALTVEKIAHVERSAFVVRLANLLEPRNGAGEAVVLSALDAARQIEARELLPVIRTVAKNPPSDACAQAAISWLGTFGNDSDAEWLEQYRAMTATLHNTAANALAQLHASTRFQSMDKVP